MRIFELRITANPDAERRALREHVARLEQGLHRERQITRALVTRAGGEVRIRLDELEAGGWQSRVDDHTTGDVLIRTGPTAPIVLGVTPLKNPERLEGGETGTRL